MAELRALRLRRGPGALRALRGLSLRDNGLRRLPAELAALRGLTELNLGNNIFEEVPEQLKYLNSLQKLHLFGNKIATISPTIFDGLEKLTLLNLNNNRLKYLPPEIHRLENLEYMSLNNNQIGSIPKELCSLEKLSELHLSYNCLITVPEEIGYMTNLRMLCLSRNQIEVLPDGLCKLRKLRILDVAGNRIWVFPTLMEDLLLMGLKELYCEDNPLLQKQPVCAIQEEEMLSLTVQPKDPVPEPCENFEREPRSCQIPYEMTARFILRELNEKDSVLQTAVKQNQEVGKLLSKKCVCAVCGQAFLTTRLECVCFMHVKQNMKISRNIHLLPVRKLICSFQCFNLRDHGFFGVAES